MMITNTSISHLMQKTPKSPQNTSNTSPPKHKPTQSLRNNTTTEPNIPPSPLAKHRPSLILPPPKVHTHNTRLGIHLDATIDLATGTGEEGARSCAAGALDEE